MKEKEKSPTAARKKKAEVPSHLQHSDHDRKMLVRVRELAAKPQSLKIYSKICDAAYDGLRYHADDKYTEENNPFYAQRAWAEGLAFLLGSPQTNDKDDNLITGFTFKEASFIEKCLSRIIPLLRKFSENPANDSSSAIKRMYTTIRCTREKCERVGRRYSFFDVIFKKDKDLPGRYRFSPLLKREELESYYSFNPNAVFAQNLDVDKWLEKEDRKLVKCAREWQRLHASSKAAQAEFDERNKTLGLEKVSVGDIRDFIKSYRTKKPRKPTPRIERDLTALFGCKCLPNCPSRLRSRDGQQMSLANWDMRDDICTFLNGLSLAAETPEEADRLADLATQVRRYKGNPDHYKEVAKAVFEEFRRVYELKMSAAPHAEERKAPTKKKPRKQSPKEKKHHDWSMIRKICESELTAAGSIGKTGVMEAARRAEKRGLLIYYKNARSAASAYSQAQGRYTGESWNRLTLQKDEE